MTTNITETGFGRAFGREARLFTLSNGAIRASFTDLGAALVSLEAIDGEGRPHETVLGYDSAEGYAAGTSSIGAEVGRYAGRIGGAGFELNGVRYELSKNDGPNHLHGGFGRRYYSADGDGDAIVFGLVSPDGDEGFPGELSLRVRASLVGNALRMEFTAETDRDTYLNITNHAYFNLNGGGTVDSHLLRVNAREYAELGEGFIPTGRILPVRGTLFDFTEARPLSCVLDRPELAATRGLDHSFMLPGSGMRTAAELYSPDSGIRLVCRTTQPTVHVYTAGYLDLDGAPCLRGGARALSRGGVCLETQHLPDSPNKPEFPSALLRAGERRTDITEFGLVKSEG